MTCRILLLFILFILTSCVCGSFVVNVTQSSYQAEENHSITLEWRFTTNTGGSPNSINVLCELLTRVEPFVLLHVHEGVEVPESQDEHFAGRVQWDKDVLREGRVRLHVSRLRTADSGQYLCDVDTSYGKNSGECQLNVSATEIPQPESQERIFLYVGLGLGLMAAALLLLALLLIIKRRKPTVYRRNSIAVIKMYKLREKQRIRTNRSLSGGSY